MGSVEGRVQVMQMQRRDGGLRPRRQDAVDGEQRRGGPLGQRAAQQQRRAEQRGSVARPARASHAAATGALARLLRRHTARHTPQLARHYTSRRGSHMHVCLLIFTASTPRPLNSHLHTS